MQTKDAPSDRRYSHFICEKCVVVDVNRATWTCRLESIHSAKTYYDTQWGVGYHHYAGGEGIHMMPEVGAHCYVATPNDNTPAFILAFVAPPAVTHAREDDPVRSSGDPDGSPTDISFQSNRPDLNPGDIAFTTRDNNFLILRRGGVLQLGATPMAQRLFLPIRNFIHDFCENYEMVTPGGDVSWTVDRPELDAAGKSACSWAFHLQEFAVDANATVRVRHLPLAAAGGKKAAWEVDVAANGIDRTSGSVKSASYTMTVLVDGTFTEVINASRTTTIKADDVLKVGGDQTVTVTGTSKLSAKQVSVAAQKQLTLGGKSVMVGGPDATDQALLGTTFLSLLASTIIVVPGQPPGAISPSSIAAFQQALSTTVYLKK